MKTFLFFLFFTTVAFSYDVSKLVKDCDKTGSLSYCIWKTPGSTNPDILYHFHGLGGSELHWGKETFFSNSLMDLWEKDSNKAPTVVTVSFGSLWILVEKNQAPMSGLLEKIQPAIPAIEARLGGLKGNRMLMGESMGGLNAIFLTLNQLKLFERVALLCPVIPNISPSSTKQDIEDYIKKNDADPKLIEKITMMSKMFIDNEDTWKKISPSENAGLLKDGPKIYLSPSVKDQWGVYRDTVEFMKKATASGANIEWRPVYGGHCSLDVTSIASFLTK